MEDLNEKYYIRLKEFIQNIEQSWRNKEITNKDALDFFKEKNNEIGFFLKNNASSPRKMKMIGLSTTIRGLIQEIEEAMKIIYVLRTDKTKMIACADESLVKKCIDRLGKDVSVATYKMKVCQTEEDLDGIFAEAKLKEQMKGPRIVHILTDKDCQLY